MLVRVGPRRAVQLLRDGYLIRAKLRVCGSADCGFGLHHCPARFSNSSTSPICFKYSKVRIASASSNKLMAKPT